MNRIPLAVLACVSMSLQLASADVSTLSPPNGMGTVPGTLCRYVPERADDFAWENDRIAFRVYGPAILALKGTEDSGIDCWLKRVPYPVINRWYAGAQKNLSYHVDHGDGHDPYHCGRSRGVGGTALWVDGAMVLSGPYIAWHIEESGTERSTFTLTYRYPATAGMENIEERKTIAIALGDDWFTATSAFTRAGKPLVDLSVAVGVTSHNGKGAVTLDPGSRWLSVWEMIGDAELGTGIALPAGAEVREIRTPKVGDASHALAILKTDAEGRIRVRAGYAWVKAGRIITAEAWQQALAKAAAEL
jgi:hypothetical protein